MRYSRIAALAVLSALATAAKPCSRVVFDNDSTHVVMVGRTLDWRTPIPTNLYVYPRGVAKQSMPHGNRLEWVSKYGSVVAVSYDGGVTEGMNDRGLVINGLFCKGSIYKAAAGGSEPVMSLSMFVSYFLDNFSTVDEMKVWLDANPFGIYGAAFDGGTVALLHWAATDSTGKTLVMEYQNGQLDIYEGKDLKVLTNDPSYPQILAINRYWEAVGGVNMMPGTVRSPDRFVRASFFINHVKTDVSEDEALGSLSGIMGTVSVPLGYTVESEPNVSNTQWRSISDVKRQRYYFKFADSISDFYIDMTNLDMNPGAPILKLDTSSHADMGGCVNNFLKKSNGFTPMW